MSKSIPVIFEVETDYDSCKSLIIGADKQSIIDHLCYEWGCQPDELILNEISQDRWSYMNIIDPDIVYDQDIHEDEDDYNVIGNIEEIADKWYGQTEIIGSDEY